MQGQRSSVESLIETFEFGSGSNTSNSVMDQQLYRNDFLLNQLETQNLSEYLLSPCDTNMPYVHGASQESACLSLWNTGASSSSERPLNQSSHDETKVENRWASTLTIDGSGPRIGESRFEATNTLSLDNLDLNLNDNQMGDDQPFSQSSNPNGFLQNFDQNVGHVGTSSQVLEAGLCPHPNTSGLLESVHVSASGGYSITCGNSSGGVGFFSEDGEGRAGGSIDGQHLSRKRKNIGAVPGQSSGGGSSSCFLQGENNSLQSVSSHHSPNASLTMSGSSDFLSGVNSPALLNPRIGTTKGLVPSDCRPSGNITGNAESSRRNIRRRINRVHERDTTPANLWHPGNDTRHSNGRSTHQPSSLSITLNEPLESMPVVAGASSQTQPHVPAIPELSVNVYPCPWNGASNSRIGSSLRSPVITCERLTAPREETNPRSTPRNDTSEHSRFVPTTDTRRLVPILPNLISSNGGASIHGNVTPTSRVGTNSGVHQPLGPTWVPHQSPPDQNHRRLLEAVHRSLVPTSSSASGGQSVNVTPQHSGSQDIGRQSRATFRGHPQPYTRSAVLTDRQRDALPVSMRTLAATREGRNRMISEHVRNMLDLIRRGENVRFEDFFLFDQSALFGRADLHDRHRDLRLDVDNMSYEELLALEERIGNVSTGLSEEMVSECLKQWKYISATVGVYSEVEPCCVCQDEYIDGDELGRLDCGHDFHAACIKQWLMQKNSCPICKTTALAKT